MSNDNKALFSAAKAQLAESNEDSDTWTVHGIAVGPGETNGEHGTKRWDTEALEYGAESLTGKPFSLMHESEAVDIGWVSNSGYEEGTGVAYEAEVHPDVGMALSKGEIEVSVEGMAESLDDISYDDDNVPHIEKPSFSRLAAVPQGASSANYTAFGPAEDNPAFAALAEVNTAEEGERDTLTVDIRIPDIEKRDILRQLAEEYDISYQAFVDIAGERSPDNVQIAEEHTEVIRIG